MNRNIEQSLLDIDFASLTRGPFTPSPAAWEDQVLYFLMLDRFSDGNEKGGHADAAGLPVETGTTPPKPAAAPAATLTVEERAGLPTVRISVSGPIRQRTSSRGRNTCGTTERRTGLRARW